MPSALGCYGTNLGTAMSNHSIQRDFEEWSGGFPPSDSHEIETYLELTLPVGENKEHARDELTAWMVDEQSFDLHRSSV